MAHTMMPTRQGPNPTSHPWAGFRFFGVRMVSTPSTRRSVPMISVRRFAPEFRIAGAVQKTASLDDGVDRKSTRLNSSHEWISYAVFCLKKKKRKRLDEQKRDDTERHE